MLIYVVNVKILLQMEFSVNVAPSGIVLSVVTSLRKSWGLNSIHQFCQSCETKVFELIKNPTRNAAPSILASTEISNSIVQGIVELIKDMMDKLVKPVVESLDLLISSFQSTQMDIKES